MVDPIAVRTKILKVGIFQVLKTQKLLKILMVKEKLFSKKNGQSLSHNKSHRYYLKMFFAVASTRPLFTKLDPKSARGTEFGTFPGTQPHAWLLAL